MAQINNLWFFFVVQLICVQNLQFKHCIQSLSISIQAKCFHWLHHQILVQSFKKKNLHVFLTFGLFNIMFNLDLIFLWSICYYRLFSFSPMTFTVCFHALALGYGLIYLLRWYNCSMIYFYFFLDWIFNTGFIDGFSIDY